MTNLTDEGLRNKAKEVCEWLNLFQDIEAVTKITAALQQVRDAAKKETVERCAKVAEKDSPIIGASIANAIRQME